MKTCTVQFTFPNGNTYKQSFIVDEGEVAHMILTSQSKKHSRGSMATIIDGAMHALEEAGSATNAKLKVKGRKV